MRILTNDNSSFDINDLPEEVDDLRFCVFDNSDPAEADYYFVPLVFLESFMSPALVLKIGNQEITMPVDWQVLIGEPEHGDLEVVPLTSINDRGFKAFAFNPLSSFRPEFLPMEIVDVFTENRWFFPKMKNGQMLCVPLTDGDQPQCAYFVKDITRSSEIVRYSQAW
jgi:hypothetical protein